MEFLKKKEPLQDRSARTNNPYIDGREEWLERYGSYISRAAQWRAVACACLGILALSLFGNIMQARQVKVVPYIVEVDKLGKVSNVIRGDQSVAAPRNLVQSEIADAIINWRTVTADTELQKQMITRLSRLITGSAKGVLKQWFEENNPYEIAKSGKLIHVEIKGLPLPVSDTSYRVEWVETIRSHAGALIDQRSYEATASIQLQPPKSEADILANPGGVYITALAASKIITN
jgi:type IV secretion system protein VirB5